VVKQRFLLTQQQVPVHFYSQLTSFGSAITTDVSGGRDVTEAANPPGSNVV